MAAKAQRLHQLLKYNIIPQGNSGLSTTQVIIEDILFAIDQLWFAIDQELNE